MDASQAAVLRRQLEWEAEDAAVLRRQRSGKRKRRREREGVAGCDLATEEELGELWNFGGRRLWNWFHGGRKQPNGWVELGKHGHLRHSFKGSSESSWWRRGDNGGLLLCFGNCIHMCKLLEPEPDVQTFEVVERFLTNGEFVIGAARKRTFGRLAMA